MDEVTYTAEEFARLGSAIDALSKPFRSVTVPNGDVDIVLVAVRIAERVSQTMAGDVINHAYREAVSDCGMREAKNISLAVSSHIRAALIKGSDHE